jgi:hydroxyethylthiazole kinase-like uncharacterized protein yjeF
VTAVSAQQESWSAFDYARLVRAPRTDDHKGTRGRVLIVGGAPGLTGAVCLAADAALRAGAGYVTVAVPAPSLPIVEVKLTAPVKIALPTDSTGSLLPAAATAVLDAARSADAVVLGPGLGRSDATVAFVRELVARVPLPLVLDADALHAIGTDLALVAARTAPTVLTPHAGEAARLLALTRDRVDADRLAAATALAVGGATVVLKGPGTLIAGGGRLLTNPSGGPELATLGTGDVLAGIIGALLAQQTPAFAAAALGAYLHGRAGEAAAEDVTRVCCTAEDVVAYLPEAFRPLLADGAPPTMEGLPMTELTARDIMTPDPVTVGPDMTVTEAAHLMTEKRIGALPVVDGGVLVGLVTESDLIMQDVKLHFPTYLSLLGGYIFAPGAADRYESSLRKAVGATVSDVMTSDPITVTPEALVSDVATLIIERDVARVPVVDGTTLIGIVSKSDIVRSLAG